MKLLLDLIVTFGLLFWPMVLFTSVMMFDAPGSENELSRILFVMAVLCYPVLIFLIYRLFNKRYFRIKANICLWVSAVIVSLAMYTFGYIDLLFRNI